MRDEDHALADINIAVVFEFGQHPDDAFLGGTHNMGKVFAIDLDLIGTFFFLKLQQGVRHPLTDGIIGELEQLFFFFGDVVGQDLDKPRGHIAVGMDQVEEVFLGDQADLAVLHSGCRIRVPLPCQQRGIAQEIAGLAQIDDVFLAVFVGLEQLDLAGTDKMQVPGIIPFRKDQFFFRITFVFFSWESF